MVGHLSWVHNALGFPSTIPPKSPVFNVLQIIMIVIVAAITTAGTYIVFYMSSIILNVLYVQVEYPYAKCLGHFCVYDLGIF